MTLSTDNVDHNLENEFPQLGQFLGCYFHQDFLEEYRDEDAAIDDYLDGRSPEQVDLVNAELSQFIEFVRHERLDDASLGEVLLVHFGCFYYAPAGPQGRYLVWLNHVRARFNSFAHSDDRDWDSVIRTDQSDM